MSIARAEQTATLLAPAADRVERSFLAAGQSLEQAVAILDRLNARFTAHVAELTDGRLESAGDGLSAAAQLVTQLAKAHSADTVTLLGLGETLAAITRRVAALQPITKEIDTLAISARVAATSMGGAGGDFATFTTSIQAAVQRARCSLTRIGEDIRRVDHDLRTARTDAEAFTTRQSETIRAIPQRLDANRRTLTARQLLARNAAAAAHQRAEAISRKVAEQIAALQLGDITRQRLEHVQAGARLLGELPVVDGLASRVLAAQLQDAADELLREGGQIERGLAQLAADARAIDRLGLDVHAETTGQQNSFVTALEVDLRQTAALFAALRTADGDTEQRIRSVLDAAGDLTDRLAGVRAVEEDIHIIGLNATLKCSRLGTAGRPLAAVAQELRACGHCFAGEAAAVLKELRQLRSQAASLLDPDRQQQHAALAQAATDMLAAVKELHRLEGELQHGVLQLEADTGQVGLLMETALQQFSERRGVAELMRQAAQQLATSCDTNVPAAARASDLLRRIAATYTMARERTVHATLTPLPQPETSPAGAAPASDPDDVLF